MFKKYRNLWKKVYQLEMENLRRGSSDQNSFAPKKPIYFLSEKLGVAYLQIPKTGCSSVLAMILEAEKPELYGSIKGQLKESVSPLHHTEGLFETTRTPPKNLVKFTFVRHPFDRVLSFYKNQVNPSKALSEERSELLEDQLKNNGFHLGMSFEDYVEVLTNERLALNEHHIRPQVEFIFSENGLNIDYLGKLEEMTRHQSILGRLINKPDLTLGRLNTTGGSNYQSSSHFNQKIVSKLEKVYKQDLLLLGYNAIQI